MNKKTFYILIGIAVLIIITMLTILALQNQASDKLTIITGNGNELEVNDFLETSERNDASALTLTDQQESAVIMYNENSKIFTILIHADEEEEFNRKRPIAEQQFLNQLGISQEEACSLNVEVATDGPETDLLEFTKPQRLSFCQ